jgi:hypothetical protein
MFDLACMKQGATKRCSSWDVSGRNADFWSIPAGESRVLADITGPGVITHIWMTQSQNYRNAVLKITWDDAASPSVLCPLGDFFGLGHGIVNSYQSYLFTASTPHNNTSEYDPHQPHPGSAGCALNCYAPMPFRSRAVIELLNESAHEHGQYFYIDYEQVDAAALSGLGFFHAEFRRACPFLGWAPEITVNTPYVNIPNLEREAWQHNYVILDTQGRGHYLGCNLSITNIQGTWWGEGDDMIWVDGYKWPPDLHGTGSEDYLNQAWGMQPNAYLRNGSSIFEEHTGGYQTSYVHHLENPVRFEREIKVTIEHGHANHLGNEVSSVAYWYAEAPTRVVDLPPVEKRQPVPKVDGEWIISEALRWPGHPVTVDPDVLKQAKERWSNHAWIYRRPEHHSPFLTQGWMLSRLMPAMDIASAPPVRLADDAGWESLPVKSEFVDVHEHRGPEGIVYLAHKVCVEHDGTWVLHVGHDGGARIFVDGRPVAANAEVMNPAPFLRTQAPLTLTAGEHELVIALDRALGHGWGIFVSFDTPEGEEGDYPHPA